MSNINFYNGRVVNVDKINYSSMDMTEDDYKKSNKNYNVSYAWTTSWITT